MPEIVEESAGLEIADVPVVPEVSHGLEGLLGAFEKLKEGLGLGNQDLSQFEHFIQDIEAENAVLRQHAEDAITVSTVEIHLIAR